MNDSQHTSQRTSQPAVDQAAIEAAAQAIGRAEALFITAGAGMGVDSGLPDFRGPEGFWRAYPPLEELGIRFEQMANPRWFRDDPELAWGFYGHRLNLYRGSSPHAGFAILRGWAEQKPLGAFVFTSNVDGHFQKAGLPENRIVEIHGSINFLQCSEPCAEEIFSAETLQIEVDESTLRAAPPLPLCPRCGETLRPNILLFGDGQWLWNRTEKQREKFEAWMSGLPGKSLTIIEIGAGTSIPSVRHASEALQKFGAKLVRINPNESQGPPETISIASGALDALGQLQSLQP